MNESFTRDVNGANVLTTSKGITSEARQSNALTTSQEGDVNQYKNLESEKTSSNLKINSVIKDHQIDGVKFLEECIVQKSSGCVLAHAMGLGKTLQIVSFCEIFLRNNSLTILMLMPVSTIDNCVKEFNLWLTDQKFKINSLPSSIKKMEQRYNIVSKWSQQGGVLIMSYEMFRSLITHRSKVKNSEEIRTLILNTDLIVCDEGHKIKSFDTRLASSLKEVTTKLRIALTGYPLQNNLDEYWCVMDFIKPNLLGSRQEFKNLFVVPISNGRYIDSSPEEVRSMLYRTYILQSILNPYVHRRSESILKEKLPEKLEYTLMFQMTKLQTEMYQQLMQNNNNPITSFGLSCKIWNEPKILYDLIQNTNRGIKSDKDIEDIDEIDDVEIPEVNLFKCFENLMNLNEYVPELIVNSPKMIAFSQILNNSLELKEKVILFSQSLHTLSTIENYLQTKLKWKKNQEYYRIDGSTTQKARYNMIEKFGTSKKLQLFLFSTKAGCMGNNLTVATRVIIFDASFNPNDDLQAIARVYRYGQTKKVFVYRFVMDNTMEKAIFYHQVNKQQLFLKVVDNSHCLPSITSSQSTYLSLFKSQSTIEEQSRVVDFTANLENYSDRVLKNILQNFPFLFTQEPLTNFSVYNDSKLSKTDEVLAKMDYTLLVASKGAVNVYDRNTEKVAAYRKSGEALVEWVLGTETKEEFYHKICLSLAGVVADNLFFMTPPSYIDHNLQSIAKIAYVQVYFLFHQQKADNKNSYSNEYKVLIDEKVNKLVLDAYEDTKDILSRRKSKLKILGGEFLKRGALEYEEIIRLIGPNLETPELHRITRYWTNVSNKCIVCDTMPTDLGWIQCHNCKSWTHVECSEKSEEYIQEHHRGYYSCVICNPETVPQFSDEEIFEM